MDNKILIADLAAAVADSTSVPKSRCNDFVKAFFEVIANALTIDGVVKVKGLGTFKLITVDERKSVNIQTGAEFIIPSHSKVTFVPDKQLKDDINKPYAHLKTYVLNSNAPLDPPEVDDDDVVLDETVDVESDSASDDAEISENSVNSSDTTDTIAEDSKDVSHADWYDNWEVEYESGSTSSDEDEDDEAPLDVDLVPNKISIPNKTDVESSCSDSCSDKDCENKLEGGSDNSKDYIQNESNVDSELNENCTLEHETVPDVESNTDTLVSNVDESSHKEDVEVNVAESVEEDDVVHHGKVLGVAIIAFLLLLGGAIFGILKIDPDFFKSLKANDAPPVQPLDSTTTLAQELSEIKAADTTNVAVPDTLLKSDSVNNIMPVKESKENVDSNTKVEKNNTVKSEVDPLWDKGFVSYMKRSHSNCSLNTSGLRDEITIKKGTFLTVVALQNYGDKAYWIYLYLYNTDRIKNPNNVPAGTKIRIPILDKSLVNGTDASKISIANEVRQKFVK